MSDSIGAASPPDAGMSDFKQCLVYLRDGNLESGLTHVQRAREFAPQNPFYLSYAGLLTAHTESRFRDAETQCWRAFELRHNHAQLYLNLSEVYLRAGSTTDAIETIETGLVSTGRDPRIRHLLEVIGSRRGRVFSVLPSKHTSNRTRGKSRHCLLGPLKPA